MRVADENDETPRQTAIVLTFDEFGAVATMTTESPETPAVGSMGTPGAVGSARIDLVTDAHQSECFDDVEKNIAWKS